jgi:hypothetical protein
MGPVSVQPRLSLPQHVKQRIPSILELILVEQIQIIVLVRRQREWKIPEKVECRMIAYIRWNVRPLFVQ